MVRSSAILKYSFLLIYVVECLITITSIPKFIMCLTSLIRSRQSISSASEATALRRYTNLIIIIIIMSKYVPVFLSFFSRLMIALIGIRWRLNARKTIPSVGSMRKWLMQINGLSPAGGAATRCRAINGRCGAWTGRHKARTSSYRLSVITRPRRTNSKSINVDSSTKTPISFLLCCI